MTATTLSFAPAASRDRRVGTARVDHWFKRAPQPQSADLQVPAEISTARVDHWFGEQARAGQWSVQGAGSITSRVDHRFEQEAQRQQAAAALRPSGVRAWWQALRERMAQARAEADLQALAMADPRVLRELQVARDLAEWKSPR